MSFTYIDQKLDPHIAFSRIEIKTFFSGTQFLGYTTKSIGKDVKVSFLDIKLI